MQHSRANGLSVYVSRSFSLTHSVIMCVREKERETYTLSPFARECCSVCGFFAQLCNIYYTIGQWLLHKNTNQCKHLIQWQRHIQYEHLILLHQAPNSICTPHSRRTPHSITNAMFDNDISFNMDTSFNDKRHTQYVHLIQDGHLIQ